MKISIISLCCIALFPSHQIVRAQGSCVNSTATAQQCVEQCLSTESLNVDSNGLQYGNLLFECIETVDSSVISNQLQTCCAMDPTCTTAMEETNQCLQGELSNVREKSEDYLSCIYTERLSNTCPFANFCVAILAGGIGSNATNDFGVGYDMNLGRTTREASTCEDMDIFGFNACTEIQGCCESCADKIAGVVNAVVDDLLLPAYSDLSDCGGDKTCSDYTNMALRHLENVDESSLGSTIIDVQNSPDIAALALECHDGLVNEIILNNTSSAASTFFECLYKNMGKIIAETEANQIDSDESSGIPAFRGAAATVASISAIVSTFFLVDA